MSAVLVLGVIRSAVPRMSPVLIEGLHTNLALAAVAFGAVHVLTSILDPFAGLGPVDALVPFVSSYRGTWLGLGVVSAYVYVASVLISWPVRRLPRSVWTWLHRLLYAAWVLALVHALGTGSDARNAVFLLLNIVAAGAALIVFLAVRVAEGWKSAPPLWAAAGALSVLVVVGVAVWAANGPLQPGWARYSGTPPALLHPSP